MGCDFFHGRSLLLAAAIALFFSGCEILGPDDSDSLLFEADLNMYEVEVIEGVAPFLNFRIGNEVRNQGNDDLVLLGCLRPSMPVLQKHVGDEWIFVYGVAEPECLSSPFAFNRGDVHRDTLRVETVLTTDGQGSFFWENHIPVNGDYRLERRIYQEVSETDDWPQLLPLEDRVSATFQIRAFSNPVSN